jgi:hypothetical protein
MVMNERIQELADKIWAEEYWDNPNTDKLLPAQLNKFAELMIKEFETVAKNPRWYFPEQQDGWRDPINCVCKEMKKHFGVEK